MSSSSTEFTASDGRRFAFPVGSAFLILAALLVWRDRMSVAWVAAGSGGAIVLAGVLVPRHLGTVHTWWMRLALAISKVTTPVFMAVVYFLVLAPTGLVMRLFGWRPIDHRSVEGSFWKSPDQNAPDMRRQF